LKRDEAAFPDEAHIRPRYSSLTSPALCGISRADGLPGLPGHFLF
jgi:hypothetical protein